MFHLILLELNRHIAEANASDALEAALLVTARNAAFRGPEDQCIDTLLAFQMEWQLSFSSSSQAAAVRLGKVLGQ